MTVTYKGINAIRSLAWDGTRVDWLKLIPGQNILQFNADNVSTVDIVTKTHDKAL